MLIDEVRATLEKTKENARKINRDRQNGRERRKNNSTDLTLAFQPKG